MSTATATHPEPLAFCRDGPEGTRDFHLHAGQHEALYAPERFIAVISGTQGGKTVLGPLFLRDEIERRGPGDYLAVAPSYPLMSKKMLPEFCRLFETQLGLGVYKSSERIFHHRDGVTKVFFGHAEDPESLESATAKAAWLDEPGQKRFRLGSWEAILRRLSIHRGRALLTTTPYDLGWLKTQIYDRWKNGDADYRVVNFASTMNPAFPKEEDERARRDLPPWKYRMFYLGLFERPAGMIYDCFDSTIGGPHVCKPFAIPESWPRFLGLDFGGVNTAGIFLARDPASPSSAPRFVAYREYRGGGRTARQHAQSLVAGEQAGIAYCIGGSKSEGQWRDEFAAGGLAVRQPPISDVEVGINRVYSLITNGQLQFFSTLTRTLDMLGSYCRPTDDKGEVQEGIEDKETYHELDALRYFAAWAKHPFIARKEPAPIRYRV